jgi:hypothetical protein
VGSEGSGGRWRRHKGRRRIHFGGIGGIHAVEERRFLGFLGALRQRENSGIYSAHRG